MVKLLLCLISATLLAGLLLQLRQQRVNLNYQANRLHSQIEGRHAELWSQQVQIATFTAPNAISRTVGEHNVKLVSPMPLPPGTANWMGSNSVARGR